MPRRFVNFEEPAFAVGQLRQFTHDGITVSFLGLYGAAIVRPPAATSSGVQALANSSQNDVDEFGARSNQ